MWGHHWAYFVFCEHGRRNEEGRSRPMDVSWWAWDPETDEYTRLVLHLERESFIRKAEETLDKLFSYGDDRPEVMVGIMYVAGNEHRDSIVQEAARRWDGKSDLLLICRSSLTGDEEVTK